MTKPNTTEDIQARLDEIEGRRAAATPGPYSVSENHFIIADHLGRAFQIVAEIDCVTGRIEDEDFLTHSWTDIGYLTEVCRGLLEENVRLTSERDCLGRAIAESAQQAGIYNGEVDLTGPELVMFCDNMRDEILRLRKENVEVLEKAIGAVQSISAGSPETLQEVIRVLRTQQEET